MTTPTQKQAGERTQHTPGPWKVCDEQIQSEGLNDYGNWIVATCQRDLTPQDEANLRLISAAPELLTACKVALSYCEQMPEGTALELRLAAAIAKAEGRAQ